MQVKLKQPILKQPFCDDGAAMQFWGKETSVP